MTRSVNSLFAQRASIVVLTAWVILSAIPHTMMAFEGGRGKVNPVMVPVTTDYNGAYRTAWGNAKGKFGEGDVIDWGRMGRSERFTVTPSRPPVVLQAPIRVPLANRHVEIPLSGEPYTFPTTDLLLRAFATITLVLAVGFLAFRNPTRTQFDLFLFAVGANPIALNARLSRYPSADAWLVYVFVIDALTTAAFVAAADFALTFAGRDAWRKLWNRALPYLSVSFLALEAWPDLGTIALGQHLELLNRAGFVLQGALVVLGALALASSTMPMPRRLIAAAVFLVGVGGNYLASLLLYSSFFPVAPEGVNDALQTLSLAMFFFAVNGTALWSVVRRSGGARRGVLHLLSQSCAATISEITKESIKSAADGPHHETAQGGFVLLFITGAVGLAIENVLERAAARLIDRDRRAAVRALQDATAAVGALKNRADEIRIA